MKPYVFAWLMLFLSGPLLAETDKWVFSEPPLYTNIDRRPERDLNYDLCLFRLKSIEGEADDLGIHAPNGKKSCPSEAELNSRTADQKKAGDELTRVFHPVKVVNDMKDHAQMQFAGLTRTWQYSKVVGFFRRVKKSPEDKGQWDSFCLAQVHTTDAGEEQETLLVCDKENVKPNPGEKAVFTCPSLEKCVGERSKHKVESPNQIGEVTSEATGNEPSENSPVSGTSGKDTKARPSKTH